MASLSSTEKRQLLAATKCRPANAVRTPALLPMSPRAYIEFATFAAKFGRSVKPVRFIGDNWKL